MLLKKISSCRTQRRVLQYLAISIVDENATFLQKEYIALRLSIDKILYT